MLSQTTPACCILNGSTAGSGLWTIPASRKSRRPCVRSSANRTGYWRDPCPLDAARTRPVVSDSGLSPVTRAPSAPGRGLRPQNRPAAWAASRSTTDVSHPVGVPGFWHPRLSQALPVQWRCSRAAMPDRHYRPCSPKHGSPTACQLWWHGSPTS
jgi:hypothetical protein